jgi:CubicO group peptidase (beta-lactamase class C family)
MRPIFAAVLLVFCIATPSLPAQRFAPVDAAIDGGIADGIYPGAVVVIGTADTILYARGYGHFTWNASSSTPDPAMTRWDLASLSKILGTTSAAAVLVQQKRLELDAKVWQYLPEFSGGAKQNVTVRMLLNHTSGMPAYKQLWKVATDPAEARKALLAVPLQRAPGASAVYSDLNAMLAGMLIERITHKPLDQFADSAVFQPLHMSLTGYRPASSERSHIAPTGRYHGQPVAGVVNDQNAVVLGGVSGHAGLFSSGVDMAHFAQAWLRAAQGHGNWINRSTVSDFLAKSQTSGSRVVGWDTPDPPNTRKPSLFGLCATTTTYGHTGWTGTELWFDPVQNIFVVLLTNRAYDPRTPKASFLQLKQVRARVADAARRAMRGCA